MKNTVEILKYELTTLNRKADVLSEAIKALEGPAQRKPYKKRKITNEEFLAARPVELPESKDWEPKPKRGRKKKLSEEQKAEQDAMNLAAKRME